MGDANLDSFPDLLLIPEGHVHLLTPIPCTCGIANTLPGGLRQTLSYTCPAALLASKCPEQ